ncbi:hypothetical protein Hanom_Chr09g00871391 [Helianthus anomalus]
MTYVPLPYRIHKLLEVRMIIPEEKKELITSAHQQYVRTNHLFVLSWSLFFHTLSFPICHIMIIS